MDLVTNVVQGSESDRLLVLLHGYGADERDLGGLLSYLDPEGHFVVVLPRGPVAAPPGFSWFDLTSGDPDAAVAGLRRRAPRPIDDLIDAACAEHGMAREQAVVGGFSQGGGLALGRRRSVRALGPDSPACSR